MSMHFHLAVRLTRVSKSMGRPYSVVPFKSEAFTLRSADGRSWRVSVSLKPRPRSYLPREEFRIGEALLWLRYHSRLWEALRGWSHGAYVAESGEERYIVLKMPPETRVRVSKTFGDRLIWAPRRVVEELMDKLDSRWLFVSATITGKEGGVDVTRVNGFAISDRVWSYEAECPYCGTRLRIETTGLIGSPPINPEKCPGCRAEIVEEICEDLGDAIEASANFTGKASFKNLRENVYAAYINGDEVARVVVAESNPEEAYCLVFFKP